MDFQQLRQEMAPSNRGVQVKRIFQDNWFEYVLFLPTLLFLLFIIGIPFLRGFWISFHEWPIVGESTWVGLDNFAYLYNWDIFWTSLKATLLYATTTIFQLIIALAAALIIANASRFKAISTSLFLIPYAMPPVTTGFIWEFLLHPDYGPFFGYLTKWGILDGPIYWQTQGDLALTAIVAVTAWTFWPFMFLIILASRESIPDSHYQAANVYGADRWKKFWYVTLPQLKSAILVAISIRLVWNLAKVSQPLQITGGGPGYDTSILAILMYRFVWQQGELGISFAIGLILVAITMLFIGLFIREFERSRGQRIE